MSNTGYKYRISSEKSLMSEGFLFWKTKTPDAIALCIDEKFYTYHELYCESVKIYSFISHLEDEIIAIQCNQDLQSYAAILAVSYLGAAYLPLNNKFPNEKLKEIISDSGVKTIMCFNNSFDEIVASAAAQTIKIEKTNSECSVEEIKLKNNSSLAYVLYTSGSTGKPKGVPVSKKNVNAFFNYFLNEYDFNSVDKFLQAYELSFDVSVFSVFCAWNVGASVYVVADSKTKHFEIVNAIKKYQLTVLSMVPGVLRLIEKYLSEFNFPFVRYSFFSGDALLHSLAVKWKKCLPNGVIHNFYGPTETTIVCTRYVWDENKSALESKSDIVPLGVSFPNMNYVLLDENNAVVNSGEDGELCYEGIQVIDAYLNKSNEDNFVTIDNKRYYKTGDVVSVNQFGNLIFHGRKDSQVKINGYRVELAEIENAITTHFQVLNKLIVINKNGLNQVCAFVESIDSGVGEKMRNKLAMVLPAYMVPTYFKVLDKLPLSVNGKIDVEKLKEMI